MNAGAHGSDISQILKKAHILFPDGRLQWVPVEEMDFSYRTSRLQKEGGLCVEAVFQLKAGDKKEIVTEMQKKQRLSPRFPALYPSNLWQRFSKSVARYAGQLIEESGLKGYRIGGAQFSELHANFIVNVGQAKAQDVLVLIAHAKRTVKSRFAIDLETEVEMVGRLS